MTLDHYLREKMKNGSVIREKALLQRQSIGAVADWFVKQRQFPMDLFGGRTISCQVMIRVF
jgi:hypothetical protein